MEKLIMRITGIVNPKTKTEYAQTESFSDDNDSCIRKTPRYSFIWTNMQSNDIINLEVIGRLNGRMINIADLYMAIEVELGAMYQLQWSLTNILLPWSPLEFFSARVEVYRRPKPSAISCPKCWMKAESLFGSDYYDYICKRCGIKFGLKELKRVPIGGHTDTNDRHIIFGDE